MPIRQWTWLPLDQMHVLEARHRRVWRRPTPRARGGDVAGGDAPDRPATGPYTYPFKPITQSEADTTDSRFTRKMTRAIRATEQSDLCHRLRADTGVHLTAGTGVANEKVTVFCKNRFSATP